MALRDRLPFQLPFGQDPGRERSPIDSMLGHTAPAPAPDQMPAPRVGAIPLGQSGRANFWGLPQPDELNQQLIGPQGLQRLGEMYRTDAHVRRLVLAAWAPIVAGTWTLEPYGGEDTTAQDKQIAQDIWWLLTEWMSPNFYEHLSQIGPLLIRSGFLPCEQVGWQTVKRSGRTLLCPRKLDLRLPSSVWRWWQDDFGELTHIGQILPNRADVIIPATELVYYRLAAEGDNWQGTSLLRHAWKHWYLKDKLERIDAIGQERKAVGVPVVYPPSGASPQVKAQLETILANLHISEVAYVMMPGPKAGSQGAQAVPQEEWLLDVIQFDSSSGEGIHTSIDYHQTAIAASFLTDFLELGHHQVGARATAEVQEDPFLTAVNGALLPPVVPPLNRFIDRIRRLNWDSAEGSPQLKLTLHDEASLSEIAAYVTPLVQAEAMQVDPELEDWLRDRGGIPPANPEIRAQRQKAQEAGMQAAQELATRGEEPGAEPPSPNADPAKPQGDVEGSDPNPNPIADAVQQTGQIPAKGKALEEGIATDRLVLLEQSTAHAGAILALLPDEPFKGVDESAREQHLTLAHLGRADQLSAQQRGTVRHVAHAFAAAMPPLSGEVSGTAEIGDGAHVALISAPGLGDHRAALTQHLKRAGVPVSSDYDFLPHVTYSYGEGRNAPAAGHRVKFSRLAVMHGDRRERIPLNGEKQLDEFAPLSGGTTTDSGLQMVPEIPGSDERCSCKGDEVDADCPLHGARQLDAAPEPTARWFDRLLSQGRLREAFDGARDHIQAACSPQTLTLARQLAHQAANATPMTAAQPPKELSDALTRHYTDLYQLGHQTVSAELAKQRAALSRQLDDPPATAAALAGSRLERARARGEHSARNILQAIQEKLGRDQITGLKDPTALQQAAEQAATAQLRVEALSNTAAMVNDGRYDSAMAAPDVVGGIYTSVLDERTCPACEQEDTGEIEPPDQVISSGPPNPDCEGGDFCRCAIVWVLSDDPAALAASGE